MGKYPLAVAIAVGLLFGACGDSLSLTEYAESLESAAVDASGRFDEVNVVFNAPSPSLEEVQAAIAQAVIISNDLHSDMQALEPPDVLADLHMELIGIHQDVLAAQENWVVRASKAESVAEILASPETQAVLSFNESALETCSQIQATLDATTAREVFQGVPWLPPQLSESIEVALGCPPATGSSGS